MSIITLVFLFIVLGIIGGLECYILINFANAFQKMELMSETFKRSVDSLTTLDASRERVYESIKSMTDSIIDQYKNLFEQYKLLKEAYDNISDGFLKACEVVKEIDEHSAVTCDKFEEIRYSQADIYAKVDEIGKMIEGEITVFDKYVPYNTPTNSGTYPWPDDIVNVFEDKEKTEAGTDVELVDMKGSNI